MTKRLLAFGLFFVMAGLLAAQDMPPLPPMPDQGQSASASAPAAAAPAASTDSSQAQTLPPLPQDNSGAAAAPAAPAASTDNSQAQALPPLPGDNGAASSGATPTPSAETEQATPAETPSAESTPAGTKPAHHPKPWEASKYRPNVIFGGWVRPNGGNETSRLAWTSAKVLDALLFHKYKLVSPDEGKPEEGSYEGQKGRQWRKFSFVAPKSKLTVEVYLRQAANKKVWLRVGPGEPIAPAAETLGEAQKQRLADLAALHLIQKRLGRRLSANRYVATWEAPYRYEQETADR